MTENAQTHKKQRTAILFLRFCLLFFLFGILYYPAEYLICQIAYPTLHQWFPAAFPTYNFVLQTEEANSLLRKQQFAAAILLFFVSVTLILRTSNRRYEAIIAKTEGLYRVPQGFGLWLRSFLAVDLPALFAAPALSFLLRALLLRLPEETPEILFSLSYFTAVPELLIRSFGAWGAYLLAVGVLSLCYVFAALRSLDRYRVRWLSSFAE